MPRKRKRILRTHARSHGKLVKRGRRRRVKRNLLARKRKGAANG